MDWVLQHIITGDRDELIGHDGKEEFAIYVASVGKIKMDTK